MMQTENPRNGGGLMLFLAFAGGALVGGAAALLFAPRTGADTRRRITGAAAGTKEFASHVPHALHEASSAARAAFTEALKPGAKDPETVSTASQSLLHHS